MIRIRMRHARGLLGVGLLGVALGFAARTAWAGEPELDDQALDELFPAEEMPEDGLSRELLLFQEIPTVTLATKQEQPLTLAPSSISVITAEDIRRQGARTLSDVLRNVPGINVNRISNSDVNVAARFPADNNNAEMLVLIDGRTVYLDFFGIVLWDALPVVMEDIARIEIIRGPAGPLYGANAYAGIVNIITKDPEEHESHTFSVTGGTPDRFVGTYIMSGAHDKWRYKAVASWDEINQFDPHDENARENLKVYTTHYYDWDEDEHFRLSLGVDDSDGDVVTGLGRFEREQQQAYVQATLTHGSWEGQLFYNYFNGDVSNPLLDPFPNGTVVINPFNGVPTATPNNPQGRSHIVNNVLDLSLQHTVDDIEDHKIIWGGGYRYNEIRSENIFGSDEVLDIFHAFVQDEWSVTDDLTLTGSVRLDHRQLTGLTVAPRLAAVYQWRPEHVFRASFAQSFRDPTQVESFIDIFGVQQVGPIQLGIVATGNRDLDPMQITSWELGYRGRYADGQVRVSADAFYNELEDIIEFLSPSPGIFTFTNVGDADSYGGELEVEYLWKPWLRASANYSFMYFRAQSDGVLGAHQMRGDRIEAAPLHKVNVGLYADWENGWSAMLQMHYVDDLTENTLNPIPPPTSVVQHLDDYTRVDGRIAKRWENPDLEVSITLFNLFNDRHREFPLGQPLGRSVAVNGTLRF